MALLEALLVGAGLGLSLAAPPGPVMAKMAFETARGRWMRGLLVGLGATSADATYFFLVQFGVLRLSPQDRILGVLALGGLVLMDFFALQAWRAARAPLIPQGGGLSGFAGGYLIAFTSPFNVAWWITSGVPFVALYGPLLAVGFFTAIVGWVILSTALFQYGMRKIERFERYVSYASAILLAGFGVLLGVHGLQLLTVAS